MVHWTVLDSFRPIIDRIEQPGFTHLTCGTQSIHIQVIAILCLTSIFLKYPNLLDWIRPNNNATLLRMLVISWNDMWSGVMFTYWHGHSSQTCHLRCPLVTDELPCAEPSNSKSQGLTTSNWLNMYSNEIVYIFPLFCCRMVVVCWL